MRSSAPGTRVTAGCDNIPLRDLSVRFYALQMGIEGLDAIRTHQTDLETQATVSPNLDNPVMNSNDWSAHTAGKVIGVMSGVRFLRDYTRNGRGKSIQTLSSPSVLLHHEL